MVTAARCSWSCCASGDVRVQEAMEGVEDLMSNLQLSAAEKKGLKIGSKGNATEGSGGHVQALGKVLPEKLIHTETVEQVLEKVWCPIKGINRVQIIGGEQIPNHFLSRFEEEESFG